MIDSNPSHEDKGDVCLEYTSTQSYRDYLLINLGASYHMTLCREWFCEYEKYDGGHVIRVDDSLTQIVK